MTEQFKIPAAASPFTPGAILAATPEETPKEVKEDNTDRKVPGVMVMPDAPPVPMEVGPEVGKTIQLSKEDLADAENKEVKAVKYCPACGCNLSEDNHLVPTTEEKIRWLRYILGEETFTGAYTLFAGKVRVTFRSRTVAENDCIFNQLTKEMQGGELPETPAFLSPAYVIRMSRLMLTMSLQRLELLGNDGKPVKVTVYPLVNATNYSVLDPKDRRIPLLQAHDQMFSSMNEGYLSAILAEHRRFELLVATLIQHSDDSDFWSPAVEKV